MMPSSHPQPRQFSTATRIHPNIVPHLQPQRKMPGGGWVKSAAAVIAVGYGVKTYVDMSNRRRSEAMDREAQALHERNERLMNMYGDRSSLEELEKAIEYYEKR